MSRLRTRVAALFATAALVTVAPATAASADDGNGLPGCSVGEICFWYNADVRYQKQFWDTANHSGNEFMDVGVPANSQYVRSGIPVQDHAWYATNRDTECRVRVGALDINGVWQWDYIPRDSSASTRHWLTNTADRNDRHERCV
ncbi:hypothetical protein AB0J86_17865 [Micromonospora sp. NPDC049559]|uniref:hypothetical protein n=1 Tax=Micromonospora sp. NPDC049559 TaxID=3155923 RepID=UPI003438B708